VVGARAVVEANCHTPLPALVAEVTVHNSGGALAAGAGEVSVKEIGGSALASRALALPALGAGQTTRAIKLALSTAQPYATLGGRHKLAVIVTHAGPIARPYTLYADFPAGHCHAERRLSLPQPPPARR
jgi:hypothetical protein